MCKHCTFLHNVWGQFMFQGMQNVLLINSLSPWGVLQFQQILYSCSYKHTALFNSSPQSLGQETVPPASLPSTNNEINFSIGFTDLNGDLTFCFICMWKYYTEHSCARTRYIACFEIKRQKSSIWLLCSTVYVATVQAVISGED